MSNQYVEHQGVTLDLGQSAIYDSMKHAILVGEYEKKEAAFIRKYCSTGLDIIEFGGCIGFISCYVDSLCKSNTNQIVVEPNPNAIEALNHHKVQNSSNFEVCEAAYAPESDSLVLNIPASGAWGASAVQRPETVDCINVETIDLEQLLHQYELSKPLNLIIDIEGGEVEMINNELQIIEEWCEIMVIEFHDGRKHYKEIIDDIKVVRKKLAGSVFSKKEEQKSVAIYQNNNLK